MLRLRLKSYLRQHGLSEADLADAIADIIVERDKPVSERYLHYLSDNTDPLTYGNKQKKPSLPMLGLIIRGLRRLTGEAVELSDLLEYVADPSELDWLFASPQGHEQKKQADSDSSTRESGGSDLVHVPPPGDSLDESLDEIRKLIARRLEARGFPTRAQAFDAAFAEDNNVSSETQRRPSYRSWLLAGMGALFVSLLLIIAYESLIVQPRLLAARGGVFSFRDRVKATSELPIPTFIGPEGEVDQLTPLLRVSEVDGALGYEFYVENLVSGDNVYTGPVTNNSFPVPEGTLCPNTPYAWRVRVLGGDGWTSFSSPLEFTVSAEALSETQQDLIRLARITTMPEIPVMVSPLGTATSTTPTLEVAPDPDVMGYGFYVRDLQTDQVIYNNNFALMNSVEVPENLLEEGGIYQWNARARNCHYWSEFTPAQVFNVDAIGGN